MNVLTCISSCLFRNKHTLIKIGRAMSYRFQDTSLRFHTLPTRCIAESRCIRDKTTLLGINTLRIHIVPRRNFLKMDPELKPLLKSKPEKDGLCMKKYELIYVS
ncbi:uncharacterized protein LOC132562152 isoform X2 [Ylistrum balloti]|nr:uncharacterized protein LOC132562152 isoform X2 [Ylistrum balloti]